jgi:hypothetical protein
MTWPLLTHTIVTGDLSPLLALRRIEFSHSKSGSLALPSSRESKPQNRVNRDGELLPDGCERGRSED